MEASSQRVWLIIDSLSSPCPFPRGWGRAGSFKLLIKFCLSGDQSPYCPGIHQVLPHYNKRLSYHPGSSQRYRSFCVRPTSPPSVRRLQAFLGALTRSWEQRPKYILLRTYYHIGDMVCYIDWILTVIQTLNYWDKSYLIMIYYPFYTRLSLSG